MKTITKEEAVEKIIANDIDTMIHTGEGGIHYIAEILRHGCQGWNNRTNEELEQAMHDMFDEQYKIVG